MISLSISISLQSCICDRGASVGADIVRPSRGAGGRGGAQCAYYAVINPENNALYAKYKAEADKFPGLRLLGRLAEYKYYNMDAIAARALTLADGML